MAAKKACITCFAVCVCQAYICTSIIKIIANTRLIIQLLLLLGKGRKSYFARDCCNPTRASPGPKKQGGENCVAIPASQWTVNLESVCGIKWQASCLTFSSYLPRKLAGSYQSQEHPLAKLDVHVRRSPFGDDVPLTHFYPNRRPVFTHVDGSRKVRFLPSFVCVSVCFSARYHKNRCSQEHQT